MYYKPDDKKELQDTIAECKSVAGMDGEALHNLSLEALKTMALAYDRVSRQIAARVGELQARHDMQARVQTRSNALAALPAIVKDQIEQGRSLSYAVAHAARVSSCPADTVAAYWSQWLRAKDQATKAARIMLVMRLAQKGLHNAEITLATGIPDYTVSRMISKALADSGVRQAKGKATSTPENQ